MEQTVGRFMTGIMRAFSAHLPLICHCCMVRWHYYDLIIMYYIVFGCFWFWYVCTTMFLFVTSYFWCHCMAIDNNASVQYSGRLLPDIIMLTQCHCTIGEEP